MQQINLYLPEFRPRREWLTARNSLVGLGLLCLTLTGLSVSATVKERAIAGEVASLKEHEAQLQGELQTLKQKPDSQEKNQLEQQIHAERQALGNRQRLVQVLEGESLGNSHGFSRQLRALSEAIPERVSLSRFAISAGGRLLTMQGQSVAPDSVAAYLASLRAHMAFAHTDFGQLKVQAEQNLFGFSLEAQSEAKPGGSTAMVGGR